MNLVTPRKRLVDVVLADSATDDDDDDDDDDEARNVRGEAIDWHDHDLEIGPTPQKHGRVIGLFDHLSSPSASSASSRTRGLPDVEVFVPPPSESTSSPGKRSAEMAFKHDRRKTTTTTTTTSTKSPLKTPVFLRRQVLRLDDDDDEGGGGGSSTPRLLFPSMPKRGLSTLINELRELEDNEEDEGMNVLREMEASLPPPSETTKDKDEENEVLPDEKVKWKKKGLKRSHRRVIMRPAKPSTSKDNDTKAREDDDDDSDEYINSADEAADDVAAMGLPKQTRAPTQVDPPATAKTKGPAKKPGGVSQNFKSLKLRNSGAKGGSRFGRSRFGGRR